MSSQEQAQTRQDIEARIVAKAWKDEAYKQELLTNPKTVTRQKFGVKFADDLNVSVREENSNSLYFVLPLCPQIEGQELSEEELNSVVGGYSTFIVGGSLGWKFLLM
ncbi:NHLP leader peptide family RiPP precursor [Nostoc sp.]|uniref:NHLP leader peptide family RiPP precursor n=1 Tax=Nostoc sp. TaxID=1180 RepID=UPI002FF73ABF